MFFSSHNTTGTSITSNTARFYGPVVFNYTGKTWTIADDMNIEGDGRGDFTDKYLSRYPVLPKN
jgi:hypothetical protein